MSVDIRVADDPARAAAELLAEAAVAGAHVALSGGSSVGEAYEAAARLQPRWRGVHVWFGDDRVVPPDDERSNYRLVRETLARRARRCRRRCTASAASWRREEAAALYDEELAGVTLDLALNGIGPDGHTASLFPNAPGLDERERRAIAAEAGLDPFVPRVTLTPPVFAEAALLVYLVAGEAKAEAVRRAFADEPSPAHPGEPRPRPRRRSRFSTRAAASLL